MPRPRTFSDENIGTRLTKEDMEEFVALMEERSATKSELARDL